VRTEPLGRKGRVVTGPLDSEFAQVRRPLEMMVGVLNDEACADALAALARIERHAQEMERALRDYDRLDDAVRDTLDCLYGHTIAKTMADQIAASKRELEAAIQNYGSQKHAGEGTPAWERVRDQQLVTALEALAPFAERAEMRWMSVEDATIEIPARLVVEIARARAALSAGEGTPA
jgi:hypothetical protein